MSLLKHEVSLGYDDHAQKFCEGSLFPITKLSSGVAIVEGDLTTGQRGE